MLFIVFSSRNVFWIPLFIFSKVFELLNTIWHYTGIFSLYHILIAFMIYHLMGEELMLNNIIYVTSFTWNSFNNKVTHIQNRPPGFTLLLLKSIHHPSSLNVPMLSVPTRRSLASWKQLIGRGPIEHHGMAFHSEPLAWSNCFRVGVGVCACVCAHACVCVFERDRAVIT